MTRTPLSKLKAKGQLAGGGGILWRPPAQLVKIRMHARRLTHKHVYIPAPKPISWIFNNVYQSFTTTTCFNTCWCAPLWLKRGPQWNEVAFWSESVSAPVGVNHLTRFIIAGLRGNRFLILWKLRPINHKFGVQSNSDVCRRLRLAAGNDVQWCKSTRYAVDHSSRAWPAGRRHAAAAESATMTYSQCWQPCYRTNNAALCR